MARVSDDGRWWVCRERPAPSQFAELVALAAAVSHHPGRRLRVLTDLEALAGLVTGWRAGGVHRWPSLHRARDRRLERTSRYCSGGSPSVPGATTRSAPDTFSAIAATR